MWRHWQGQDLGHREAAGHDQGQFEGFFFKFQVKVRVDFKVKENLKVNVNEKVNVMKN